MSLDLLHERVSRPLHGLKVIQDTLVLLFVFDVGGVAAYDPAVLLFRCFTFQQ